jgi:DNA-binding NarL/FixJ family response regulator
MAAAAHFLTTVPGVAVVGCASSGLEGLTQVVNLQPDLVFIDVAMPGMSGLEATRYIKAQPNAPQVIILTMHDSPEYRAAAEIAGADGFITKSDFGARLPALIQTLFNYPEPDTPLSSKGTF